MARRNDLLCAIDEARMGRRHDQDQMRDRIGIAGRVRHRDHAAVTRPDAHDRTKPEMATQSLHVLDILVEHVACGIVARRAPLPAMVEEDELHRLR